MSKDDAPNLRPAVCCIECVNARPCETVGAVYCAKYDFEVRVTAVCDAYKWWAGSDDYE